MLAGRAAASTLVILALGLGATACGSSGAKKPLKATQVAADARWRLGIALWHKQMLGALDGISIMLSSAAGISLLEAADHTTVAKLDGLNQTLSECSAALAALGPVPSELVEAQQTASRACGNLERGAGLVAAGVKALQHGGGARFFNRATTPLSTGQDEMSVATRQVHQTPPPE